MIEFNVGDVSEPVVWVRRIGKTPTMQRISEIDGVGLCFGYRWDAITVAGGIWRLFASEEQLYSVSATDKGNIHFLVFGDSPVTVFGPTDRTGTAGVRN